jgi:hypothetical protein
MASIGDLFVRIGGDTKGLQRAANKSKGLAKNIGASLGGAAKASRRLVNSLGGMVPMLAAAAGALGLGALIKSSLEAVDAQAKLADKLGISMEGLQGITDAAEQAGVKASATGTAIQRMVRRIAEAAKGTGEAKDALKEMGLDAVDLQTAGPEEALKRIADKFKDVGDQSTRVRLAFKLFDTEGVALVNLLKGGREAIDAVNEEMEQMGLLLSRADAAKIETFNDSMNRLKSIFSALADVATSEISPFMKAAVDKMIGASKESGNLREKIVNLFEDAVKGTGAWMDALNGVMLAFETVRLGLHAIESAFISITAGVLEQIDNIADALMGILSAIPGQSASAASDAILHWRKKLPEWQSFFDEWGGASAAATEEAFDDWQKARKAYEEGVDISGLLQQFQDIRNDANKTAAAVAAAASGSKGPSVVDPANDPFFAELFKPLTAKEDKMLKDLGDPSKDPFFAELFDPLSTEENKVLKALEEQMTGVSDSGKESFSSMFDEVAEGFGDMEQQGKQWMNDLVDIIDRGLDTGEFEFGEFFRNIGNQLKRSGIESLIGGLVGSIIPGGGNLLGGGGLLENILLPSAGGSSKSLAALPGGGGSDGTTVQLFDQRQSGAPLERRESKSSTGERQMKIFIKDTVNEGFQERAFDDNLNQGFGMRRRGR